MEGESQDKELQNGKWNVEAPGPGESHVQESSAHERGIREPAVQDSEIQKSDVRRFARAINDLQFYEAHEIMEEVWICQGRPRPSFAQGLVQIAAALEHVKRGNPRGARALAERGLENCLRTSKDQDEALSRFVNTLRNYAKNGFSGNYPQCK